MDSKCRRVKWRLPMIQSGRKLQKLLYWTTKSRKRKISIKINIKLYIYIVSDCELRMCLNILPTISYLCKQEIGHINVTLWNCELHSRRTRGKVAYVYSHKTIGKKRHWCKGSLKFYLKSMQFYLQSNSSGKRKITTTNQISCFDLISVTNYGRYWRLVY